MVKLNVFYTIGELYIGLWDAISCPRNLVFTLRFLKIMVEVKTVLGVSKGMFAVRYFAPIIGIVYFCERMQFLTSTTILPEIVFASSVVVKEIACCCEHLRDKTIRSTKWQRSCYHTTPRFMVVRSELVT